MVIIIQTEKLQYYNIYKLILLCLEFFVFKKKKTYQKMYQIQSDLEETTILQKKLKNTKRKKNFRKYYTITEMFFFINNTVRMLT